MPKQAQAQAHVRRTTGACKHCSSPPTPKLNATTRTCPCRAVDGTSAPLVPSSPAPSGWPLPPRFPLASSSATPSLASKKIPTKIPVTNRRYEVHTTIQLSDTGVSGGVVLWYAPGENIRMEAAMAASILESGPAKCIVLYCSICRYCGSRASDSFNRRLHRKYYNASTQLPCGRAAAHIAPAGTNFYCLLLLLLMTFVRS